MSVHLINNINEISKSDWNALTGIGNPFLRYEFFHALEQFRCVGSHYGWIPQHIVYKDSGRVIGLMPLYVKHNSYGELVFDWNWADAYRRAGIPYYPKLVSAIPYTPVTSQRVFFSEHRPEISKTLVGFVRDFAEETGFSSLHILFPPKSEIDVLNTLGMMTRMDVQFHWLNRQYQGFEEFLEQFTAKKRKNVNRERRLVRDQNVQINILHGSEMDERLWQDIYPFYRDTFLKKSGMPTLSEQFFVNLSREIGDQLVVFTARYHGEYVAAAICFRSEDTLYGRHWGCHEQFDSLHFELCYYQGIEYAIKNKLSRFEPGAQGEHKLSRGFLPQLVYSAHWIRNLEFQNAIRQYLSHETQLIREHAIELSSHSPFRAST